VPLEVGRGYAEHLAFFAAIESPFPAGRALIAVNRRIEADPVAPRKSLYVAPNLLDDAGGFVTHNQGRQPSTRLAGSAMNIRAAYPAGPYANKNIVVTGRRIGKIRILESVWRCVNQGLQLVFSKEEYTA
jgi:hypothetical protein